MKPYRTSLLLMIPLLFCGLLFFSSCEEDTVTKTVEVIVKDTVLVSIISVDELNAVPDSVTEGGSVTLTADVSTKPEAGSTLTFKWFAEAGELSATEGDTVTWKAPGEPGAYSVSVHVTDGQFIALGSRLIGVGMYAPTATPYYVGDEACGGCHGGVHDTWSETGHADAWATLQNSGHPASYCNPCHTVGFVGDNGNSGYDEAPIAKFEDVQCENCHGPGSEHFANGVDVSKIQVSYDSQTCGVCHEGTHHPYVTEWEESAHSNAAANHGAAVGSCQGCHEGVAGAVRLAGDLSTFYGSGSTPDRPEEQPVSAIGCATCHDSHKHENPGQIRTMADIPLVEANGENPIITEGGTGKLCMHCHHARRAPEGQIDEGYGHFGPHGSPQADMAAGKSAYHAVADPGFQWADPSHLKVQNSCKTCHLNMAEYVSEEEPAKTGHTFEPTVEACANCHGEIASFEDIMALDDFDGDGSIEGVQNEVSGLMSLLETALIDSFAANGITTTGWNADSLGHEIGIVKHAIAPGDTLVVPNLWREAGYNWIFVLDDKSLGVHNPDYAVQILQQTYRHLTGSDVGGAAIVRNGKSNSVAAIRVQ